MYNIIDTHCHLDIVENKGLSIKNAVDLAKNSGVKSIVQIGVDLESSLRARDIARDFTDDGINIHFTAGIHPTDIHEPSEIPQIRKIVEESLDLPDFTGVGEVGLDLYHDKSTLPLQENVLNEMLSLAEEYSLPVVIHSRDAAEETYSALKNFKDRLFGVIHCFTYNYEYAKKFVDLGYFVSFSGIVAFNNARDIQDTAARLPLDTILIETDAPFLAPPPHRGKRNDSSNMVHILEKMFSLREEDPETVAEQLFTNSMKFIGRKPYA